jgi:uncharacterized Zn-finger protein
MRTCIGVVIKGAFIHDLEADLIRNHPMGPKEFVCCWNIPIKSKKWITNLTKHIEQIRKKKTKYKGENKIYRRKGLKT